MAKELLFGIQTNGIKHRHDDGMPDIDTRFRMVKEAGVFDYVVQHGRHQALMVHVHVGEDIGYGKGMGNVRLAAASGLAVVGLLGVEIGAPDQVDLIRLKVIAKGVGKNFYRRHAALPHPW